VVCPAVVGGFSLIAAAFLGNPILAAVALTISAMGIYAALPTFWTLPTGFLTGSAAAGGIALINSIGNSVALPARMPSAGSRMRLAKQRSALWHWRPVQSWQASSHF
jgi:hypothetical protein